MHKKKNIKEYALQHVWNSRNWKKLKNFQNRIAKKTLKDKKLKIFKNQETPAEECRGQGAVNSFLVLSDTYAHLKPQRAGGLIYAGLFQEVCVKKI